MFMAGRELLRYLVTQIHINFVKSRIILKFLDGLKFEQYEHDEYAYRT